MAAKMKVMTGCDPEIFVKKARSLVPVHDMTKGTKGKGVRLTKSSKVEVDGLALEFTIQPAATSKVTVARIQEALGGLAELAKKHKRVLHIQPSVTFSAKTWDNDVPDEQKILGCDPDYNAYTGEQNPAPDNKTRMRVAGGHIHIGWLSPKDFADPRNPNHFADCRALVQELEATLGPILDAYDDDDDRRKMYGKPGAFRPKPYGVEWRSPSNAWLRMTPEQQYELFRCIRLIVRGLRDGERALNNEQHMHFLRQHPDYILERSLWAETLVHFINLEGKNEINQGLIRFLKSLNMVE